MAPREGLELELVKMGRTRPPLEPHRRPQAGKSGDPRFQNADKSRGMRQRFPYRCNKTKTNRMVEVTAEPMAAPSPEPLAGEDHLLSG